MDPLLSPDAYPPPRPSRVELRETHVSWVYLTDGEAYKRKKPVNLGFLDFRTMEQRRLACEAEVSLNARLAPGVYLGVVPLARDATGALRFGGSGEIVDWAVRMKRLPDARRADVLLAEGRLGARVIDEVAETLARFHARAASDARIAAFGAPDAIARNVEENFAQTRGTIGRWLAPAEARGVIDAQRAFLRDHEAVFAARVANDRVKDGHGDLRLEHVYVADGGAPLTILDCIEFNDRFRYADVACDLAFLSMDLAAHDRVDLAERLLARYARAAQDYDLYAVVDFYEAYRAFVRGKVQAMLATDETAGAEARAAADREARRYFLLALAAERAAVLGPMVVAVGGVIASGKSTIAEWLAARMDAPIVDADRTRKHMMGLAPTTRLHDAAWSGAYDLAFTEKVYAEAIRRADVVVGSGRPVILDASFRAAGQRALARALAAKHGVPFRFVECRAPAEVCRARLAEREQLGGVSDGRRAIFDAFAARFEPVIELPASEHVVVETGHRRTLVALESKLASWPPGLAR